MGSGSIWQWLLVLFALALPAGIILVAVHRARDEGGVMAPGFKGWLFLLAASVWITPLRGLAEMARMSADLSGAAEDFPWLVRADLVINGASVLVSAACLVLMLRRSAAFRIVFPVAAAWVVLSFPVSVLVARWVLAGVYGVEVGVAELFAALRNDIPQWLGGAAAAIAWVVYVRRSARVAMTFVA